MHYTLQDRVYFDALKTLTGEFHRQDLPYALVGGAGIQARIANILCSAQGTDLPGTIGLEHLLRETHDFDITSTAPEESFVRYFNELQALNPHLSVRKERARSKRLTINTGREKSLIFVNYQTGPQDLSGLDESFYYECIDNAEPLNLNYGNSQLSVSVANPECLVTSKLTRWDTKDILDISNLLRTMRRYGDPSRKLDEDVVKGYLAAAKRGAIFGRLEELKEQVLKE